MDQISFKYLDKQGFKVAYLGSLESQKALVFIRRNNKQKNSAPLQELLNKLVLDGYLLLWPESRDQSTSLFLNTKSQKILLWLDEFLGQHESLLKKSLRRLAKGLILLRYPSRWDFMLRWQMSHPIADDVRVHRQVIQTIAKDKSVSIFSHSAGGVIASYLVDEPNLQKIICFGYPFKHPDKQEEPYRTRSLHLFSKPFLIIQGRHDEYGGLGVESRYELSPAIRLEFVDANHEYENLSDDDWSKVVRSIELFLC